MSSQQADAPNLVQAKVWRSGFRVMAPSPAPTLCSPYVKKASFGSFSTRGKGTRRRQDKVLPPAKGPYKRKRIAAPVCGLSHNDMRG